MKDLDIAPDLWRRIAAFELDDPASALPFSRRLARENGWSHAFAQRAVEEYRRFVFLAMVAGHPVTPSDEVDQVWHLHLCYTRSYWDEMCGRVLPRPLHHGPTRGGAAEAGKFDAWYRDTLASYERVFGAPPPADLWPAPGFRFAQRRWRRVDLSGAWIVRRQAVLAGAAALLLLLTAGCSDGRGWLAIGYILAGVAIPALLIWFAARYEHRGRGGGDSGCAHTGHSGCGDARGSDDGCGDSGGGDGGCGGGGCGGGCGD